MHVYQGPHDLLRLPSGRTMRRGVPVALDAIDGAAADRHPRVARTQPEQEAD